jgi:ferric-dicitrate binding protein FerR (iron transport regulator)
MKAELLNKYFNNSCTEAELKSVLNWFEESAGTPEGKLELHRLWESISPEDENVLINYDLLLERIHNRIIQGEAMKNKLQSSNTYQRRERILSIFMRAASILILPFVGFGIYMAIKYQSIKEEQLQVAQACSTVSSSVDAITKVTLPDSTIVWLNHSSTLSYPLRFSEDSRIVELVGEGYFEVAHNPGKPFIVHAGDIEIKDLGTTFNIMAYPEEEYIETSLIEGEVELHRKASDGKKVFLLKMKPTDFAVYNKGKGTISARTISDARYFAWKDGLLVFNEEPLNEMVKKLSRWYNVDIQIEDESLLELSYTATFVNESLRQVLELLSKVSPVSYSISEREKRSDGSFTKSKVILSYRND